MESSAQVRRPQLTFLLYLCFSKKTAISKHKASLDKLKESDPEFYKFLEQEDSGLLDFNPSDASEEEMEEGSEEEEEEEEEDEQGGRVHKLPTKLEVNKLCYGNRCFVEIHPQ